MTEIRLSCVLLADSHKELSEGVRGLLETKFATVVMVADETSLIEASGGFGRHGGRRISLSRHDGLNWVRAVQESCPGVKVIALSVHDEQSVRRAAMQAGADAFVPKQAIATDLLSAIARVRGDKDDDRRSARRERRGRMQAGATRFTDFEVAVEAGGARRGSALGCRHADAALGRHPRRGRAPLSTRRPARMRPSWCRCRQPGAAASQGGAVIGLPDGLHVLDGERSPLLVPIERGRAGTRTNDGACDAAGRLWVGTMALDEASPVAGCTASTPTCA